MKHVHPVTKRPGMAFDPTDLPVDIEFLIDMMTAFIEKKSDLGS